MWIVRLALRRPYTFTVMALLIVILGLLTARRMAKDTFPSIDIPVVSVLWSYNGLTPDEIFATGDHFNDLPMLDGLHAKHVACPGNSCDEVKKLVRTAGGYIARGTASEGVVEALRHFGAWPVVKA